MEAKRKIYLSTWEYNAALILTELARLVQENGGKVAPSVNMMIVNRNFFDARQILVDKIKALETLLKLNEVKSTKERLETLQTYRKKVDEYDRALNAPPVVTHISYIRFVLDGYYYHYQMDSNPLLDFYYVKTPIVNGDEYSLDACMEEDKKGWLAQFPAYAKCTSDDARNAAESLLQMLKKSDKSNVRTDTKQKLVRNSYYRGCHKKTTAEPERFAKITF